MKIIFIVKLLKIEDLWDASTEDSLPFYLLEHDILYPQIQNKVFTYRFAKKNDIILKYFLEENLLRFICKKKKSLEVDEILRRGQTQNFDSNNKITNSAVKFIKIISRMMIDIYIYTRLTFVS